MNEDSHIPLPVRLNALKHHRNYILGLLESASPELAARLLESVNNNYIDIYYGSMTPAVIVQSIIEILRSKQVLPAEEFTRWVESNEGYRKITLPDHSEWIVRRSNDEKRYVHLHPSRSGACTIRFKGSSLKTVYLLKAKDIHSKENISLELVNRLRIQAGLSPVKNLERISAIIHCFENFFSREL